jgi:hypothetical protein
MTFVDESLLVDGSSAVKYYLIPNPPATAAKARQAAAYVLSTFP